MLLSRIKKALRSRISKSGHEPLFYHERFSRENPFFLELRRQSGCNHSYAWGVLQAADLAKRLGLDRISVLEFGVAGGNGLVAMERISERVSQHYGVAIDVIGFDTGVGLPAPQDNRDLPDICREADFPMDQEKLRQRLKTAKLFLGQVGETISDFVQMRPAPIAFISFDMDFYSSTMQGVKIFDAGEELLLPRIHCFFDDVFACGDFNGERLAISEFNASHASRKISQIHGLKYFVPDGMVNQMLWEKYYMAYIFDHSLYGRHLLGKRFLDLAPAPSVDGST